MTPEVFGRSLLFHLQISYGYEVPLEAECLFYGQSADGRVQAAVLRTRVTAPESVKSRIHFFTGDIGEKEHCTGFVGNTVYSEQILGNMTLLETGIDQKAVVTPGAVVVMLGSEILKQIV